MKKINVKCILPIVIYCLGYIFGLFTVKKQNLVYNLKPQQLNTTDLILHNSTVIFWLIFGIISAGIITMIILFLNGAILGATVHACLKTSKLSKILLLIVPHGIFEIPSFIITGIGVLYIINFIKDFIKYKKNTSYKYLKIGLVLFIIALILIIIAGYVEANFNL